MRIYLDTCVWCRPFDQQSPQIKAEAEAFFAILQGIDRGRFSVLGSVVLEEEIQRIGDQKKREAVLKLMPRAIPERVEHISESMVARLKQMTGVKDWDAFHLTAALEGEADFFVTVDQHILRQADRIAEFGLKVRHPVEFLEEVTSDEH